MPANRNRNARGGGGGRNFNQGHRVQPFGSDMMASQGSLMSNHLQLDELDLELALLKRKREMIEKQHTMLVSGSSSQYGFNQANQSYGQDSTRNFSQYYSSAEPQYGRFNSQQGVKRSAIDPWDNSSPPKRFNASSGFKKSTTRYEPRSQGRPQAAKQPPPLMSSTFRPRRPPPSATRPNFKPNKVTKPRQNNAPNKLNSYPVAERKELVAKASGLSQKSSDPILYESDKPPNSRLQGRLALALGSIVREMRDVYGTVEPHAKTFTSMANLRALKNVIRERIRLITVGTHVGSAIDVMALYRKKHPKETDEQLLDNTQAHTVQSGNLAIEIIKQGNPEKYFRTNFRRLLDASLTEMFERVQLLYTKVRDGTSIQQVIDDILVDLEKPLIDENVEHQEEAQEASNNDIQPAEDTETGESGVQLDESAEVDETATESEETLAQPDENAANPEENVDEPEEKADEPKQNGDTSTEIVDTEVKDAGNNEVKPRRPHSRHDVVRAKFYSRLMDTLMRRNLPSVLPKYKEFLLRILGTNEAFKETKAYLVKTTNEKVEADNKADSGAAATPGAKKEKTYFVKIVGRSQLPKKKLMKAFLDTFHPTLIKKHRNSHNILFVSFDSEENFNNILAKNGEVIGSSTLDIKVSERVNKNKNESQTPNADQQNATPDDTKPDDTDDVQIVEPSSDEGKLDESLDNQITDLLTSITEEEEKTEDNEEVVNDENDENSQTNEEANMISDDGNNDQQTEEVNNDQQNNEEKAEAEKTVTKVNKPEPKPAAQKVEAAKTEAKPKGTPVRTPARQPATPSNVRTRRASKIGN